MVSSECPVEPVEAVGVLSDGEGAFGTEVHADDVVAARSSFVVARGHLVHVGVAAGAVHASTPSSRSPVSM